MLRQRGTDGRGGTDRIIEVPKRMRARATLCLEEGQIRAGRHCLLQDEGESYT